MPETECRDLNKLTSAIELWGETRGLHTSSPLGQMAKVTEEVGELARSVVRDDAPGVIDSLGDVFVTLVVLSQQYNLDIRDCVNEAYNVIKDRDGEKINGIFVKSDDLTNKDN